MYFVQNIKIIFTYMMSCSMVKNIFHFFELYEKLFEIYIEVGQGRSIDKITDFHSTCLLVLLFK